MIQRVYDENFVAYGGDKMWDHLNNVDGIRVARCTVERLMREMGLSGVRRGRSWIKTTITDDGAERPADLVDRDFTAEAPNRLWLADLTYVKTHAGWVYVAFIIDAYSRFVVGWQASTSLRSDLAIDALEMAVFNRRRAGDNLDRLVHHSDMGVQYLVDSILAAARRQRRRRLGRLERRFLRQRDDRVVQRPLQVGTHLPPRALERPRGRRVRHPRIRRLVQPPTPPRRDPPRPPPVHHPRRPRIRTTVR